MLRSSLCLILLSGAVAAQNGISGAPTSPAPSSLTPYGGPLTPSGAACQSRNMSCTTGWTGGNSNFFAMTPLRETKPVAITGLTVRTKALRATAKGVIELWLVDSSGRPKTRVRTGSILVTTTFGNHTGKFTTPYPLPANTAYAVVFSLPNIAHPICRAAGTQQTYYWHPPSSTTWSGVFRHRWMFRVECGGSNTGSFVTYGRACRGTAGTPVIGNSGLPTIGKSFGVTLSSARKQALAPLLVGASNKKWLGLNLPFDLAVIGAPNCFVNASGEAILGGGTNTSGQRTTMLAIPNLPGLLGNTFFTQYAVFDPGANAFGLVTTSGGAATVGK